MHPILSHPRRLALYVAAWLPVGALLALALGRQLSWVDALAYFLPLSTAYAFITLSTWYVCRAFPLGERTEGPRPRSWQAVLAVHGLGGAVASLIWVGMARAWAAVFVWLSGRPGGIEALGGDGWGLLFLAGVLLFWLAVVVHYLLIAFESSRDAERQAFELRLLARESELRALRAQLDPHFIFNSLHSISALTTRDPAAARRMCLLLAEFLRDTLRLGSHARISLAEEVRLAERFLAIEEVRLGPRLRFVSEVPEAAGRCLVPPLLLQPVVENAVVHGVAQTVDGGTIRLSAACSDAMLTVAVENPCDADAPRRRGAGLGLELLRRRLTTHFGAYDPVRTTEQEGRFLVEIRLPAEAEDAAPETRTTMTEGAAAAEGPGR